MPGIIEIKGQLNTSDFEAVLFKEQPVQIQKETLKDVEESFDFLLQFSENKVIYGVNTGFGPMAQYKIKDEERIALQYNLIRSHASGSGKPLSADYVRAAMLARINTLSLAKSGIHPSVLELMVILLNKNITPLIFSHGGVGASGDLVQLAHLALVLIGEGEVFYKNERRLTKDVYQLENIKPIDVKIREGLALMNGTSVMSGIGMVNVIFSKRALNWMVKISAAINEIVAAYDDHLSFELNDAKQHPGQQEIAKDMRKHIANSKRIRKREHHLYQDTKEVTVFDEKVQEYYSLRCIPQILGPVLDTISQVEEVLINEVNSANDNPIIDLKNKNVYHGGNFHGDYVSLEMDKLKLVVTKMTMLAERQLNYLFNSKLNNLLPPFLNGGQLGLNYGMQGVQFTATSTTAESQMLSNSMYVHSISTNNDNQDIVSMGTNAALITAQVVENCMEVLAIELLAVAEAIDRKSIYSELSSATKNLYDQVRAAVPATKEDEVWYPKIAAIKTFLLGYF